MVEKFEVGKKYKFNNKNLPGPLGRQLELGHTFNPDEIIFKNNVFKINEIVEYDKYDFSYYPYRVKAIFGVDSIHEAKLNPRCFDEVEEPCCGQVEYPGNPIRFYDFSNNRSGRQFRLKKMVQALAEHHSIFNKVIKNEQGETMELKDISFENLQAGKKAAELKKATQEALFAEQEFVRLTNIVDEQNRIIKQANEKKAEVQIALNYFKKK